MPKNTHNYCTIALISHTSKVRLKIFQARIQQYMKCVQVGFRKGRGTRNQTANIICIIEEAREFQKKKNLLLFYWLHQSIWLCCSQQTVENPLKKWKYQTTWPASWEICVQVRKQQLELDIKQTGSKSGKEYAKAV